MTNLQLDSQLKTLAQLTSSKMIPEALALGEQLAALSPDDPRVLSLLGSAYGSAGKFHDSERCYKQLVSLEPDSSLHYYYLGMSLIMQGRLREAAEPFEIMLRLDPRLATGHMQTGCLQRDLGNYDQAIIHLRKAVELSPTLHDAKVFLANLLVYQNQMDEAMGLYEQVLSWIPFYPDALAGKASVLEKQGRFDASWMCLSQVIDHDTVTPNIAIIYAKLAQRYNCTEHANTLLNEILSRQSLAPSQRQEIHFSLGALNDITENYNVAFNHFMTANSLSPYHFDISSMVRRTQAIRNAFSDDSIPVADNSTDNSPAPIFIVGMPRSGSSLVEQILGCHPDVTAAGESSAMELVEASAPEVTGNLTGYPDCLRGASIDAINTLADLYIKSISEASKGGKLVTDKLPTNYERLGLIAKLFPNAFIINTSRHPFDICLSCYFQNFGKSHAYSSSLRDLAVTYNVYKDLMSYWKSILPTKIHNVNYESLVNDPEQVVRKLLEFCGLQWHPHCLEFHKSSRYVHTASYSQVRQPIYHRSVGRWRHYESYIGELTSTLR